MHVALASTAKECLVNAFAVRVARGETGIGCLLDMQLLIRTAVVPAAEVPPPRQLGRWLEQTWTQVDSWVAAHAEQPRSVH